MRVTGVRSSSGLLSVISDVGRVVALTLTHLQGLLTRDGKSCWVNLDNVSVPVSPK